MQPNKYHRELLSRLSVNQLEEAMFCLHQDLPPQDQQLQELRLQEWSLLHELLAMLLLEKRQSSLH